MNVNSLIAMCSVSQSFTDPSVVELVFVDPHASRFGSCFADKCLFLALNTLIFVEGILLKMLVLVHNHYIPNLICFRLVIVPLLINQFFFLLYDLRLLHFFYLIFLINCCLSSLQVIKANFDHRPMCHSFFAKLA